MADEEDASLLEDAKDRLVGKGIVVDQSQCGPGFRHTEQAPKARWVPGRQTTRRYQPTRGLMPELMQEYRTHVQTREGVGYTIRAYGELRSDGTWEGWLEFQPSNRGGPILKTGRETTQPDRSALAYWASGLEPVYLEGAFGRAIQALKAGA